MLNMIDKTTLAGISGGTAAYITADIMPFVSLAIGVTTLVYMCCKIYYLFKHHGYEVPVSQHDEDRRQ